MVFVLDVAFVHTVVFVLVLVVLDVSGLTITGTKGPPNYNGPQPCQTDLHPWLPKSHRPYQVVLSIIQSTTVPRE